MLALQTRQQLSSTALSLASQADQAVLRLFLIPKDQTRNETAGFGPPFLPCDGINRAFTAFLRVSLTIN